MSFKINFPPSSSQSTEYKFWKINIASIETKPGSDFSSEKLRRPCGLIGVYRIFCSYHEGNFARTKMRIRIEDRFSDSSPVSKGRGAEGNSKEPRSIKAGLPLMSFANGRNFRIPLRLIVFGVGFGESANRRLGWDSGFGVLVLGIESRLRACRATWRDERATYHDRENHACD